MENLIVANWKMNPVSKKEAIEIFSEIKQGIEKIKNSEIVICPPFLWLAVVSQKRNEGGLSLGAQDCFYEERGAFTGEISPAMLKDLSVEYVILGHSERRKHFGETDEIINKKIEKALEAGLKVIFCIGETQEQRNAGERDKILENQIKLGLAGILNFKFQISNLSIAYEPVWAIGTGNNCSVEDAETAFEVIRKIIPENIRILYGGSVKSENSGSYIKEAGANGLLIGGASLNAEEFVKIAKSAE